MTTLNTEAMSTKQLVEWYNQNVEPDKMVKKFKDRSTAERRCVELAATVLPVEDAEPKDNARPAMKESLKLDRTVSCLTTGGTWKNAYRMWVENPDWMTSSQQDRLTAQLYRAAKQGEKIQVEINGRAFELVSVERK